jgi:hypothetical protein
LAKKKEERKPVFPRSTIKLVNVEEDLQVLEGYATVKKRLFDNCDFFEVTNKNRCKITLNKKIIADIRPVD